MLRVYQVLGLITRGRVGRGVDYGLIAGLA